VKAAATLRRTRRSDRPGAWHRLRRTPATTRPGGVTSFCCLPGCSPGRNPQIEPFIAWRPASSRLDRAPVESLFCGALACRQTGYLTRNPPKRGNNHAQKVQSSCWTILTAARPTNGDLRFDGVAYEIDLSAKQLRSCGADGQVRRACPHRQGQGGTWPPGSRPAAARANTKVSASGLPRTATTSSRVAVSRPTCAEFEPRTPDLHLEHY